MKKSNPLKQTISEINQLAKMLKESYIFDDTNYDNEEYNDEDYTDEVNSEQEVNNPNNFTEKISQIRNLALEGIQDFASDVDSEEYDFFKKVWLMCDKVCSEKDKNNIDKEEKDV